MRKNVPTASYHRLIEIGALMGKTLKKQRSGKRVPREAAALPENMRGLVAPNPSVECPHCRKSFWVQDGAIMARGRRCPRCEKLILPEHYEHLAHKLEEKIACLRRSSDHAVDLKGKLLAKRDSACNKLAILLYDLLLSCIGGIFASAFEKAREADALTRELERLAASEYYINDWFSYGGKPLSRSGMGPLQPYGLSARYADGRLDIRPGFGKGIARGIAAEWELFYLLDRAIAKGDLPADMVLCPNVFIRNPNADEREAASTGGWSSWTTCTRGRDDRIPPALFNQIDLVALSSNAVYIFEVKSRKGSITVNALGKVGITPFDGAKKMSGSKDLRQCARHASAFATRFASVPFERIYEITVYADTTSFVSQQTSLIDNAGAFCIDGASSEQLLSTLQDIETDWSKRGQPFGKPARRKMLQALRGECVDTNGRKEYLHIERIETIVALEKERR